MSGEKFSTLGIRDGDIIFFMRHSSKTDLENAIKSVVEDCDVFHVGMFCSNMHSIVHTTQKNGVVIEAIDVVLHEIDADRIEIYSIKAAKIYSDEASKWAKSKFGCAYNDIFSNKCRNSFGLEAYYCCQFIIKAYESCKFDLHCPPYTLNFTDPSNGYILPFWSNYYAKLSLKVPQGEPGSHPANLKRAKLLELRFSKNFRQMSKKFRISRTINEVLHFAFGATMSPAKSETTKIFDVIQPRNGLLIFFYNFLIF